MDPQGGRGDSFREGAGALAVIVLLALAAFHGVGRLYFVGSDFKYLAFSRYADLRTMLSQIVPHPGNIGVIYVTSWVWKLDYLLWGGNPAGYFYQALGIHCLNAFLLYRLCRALALPAAAALLAGCVFAVYPLDAEVVCVPYAVYYNVTMVFLLAAMLRYVRYATGSGGAGCLAAAVAAHAAALLTFEGAVTLPPVLWCVDALLLPGREGGTFLSRNLRRLGRISPFLACVAAYALFRRIFGLWMNYPPAVPYQIAWLCRQLFVEIPLVMILPFRASFLLGDIRALNALPLTRKLFLLGLVAASSVIFCRIRPGRPWRFVFACLLWVYVCIIPFWRMLWTLDWNLGSSRHFYLASAGFAMGLAAFLAGGGRKGRALGAAVAALLLALYAALSAAYVGDRARGSAAVRGVMAGVRSRVADPRGKNIYLMNVPWQVHGTQALWNPIDVMMMLSPETTYAVYRDVMMLNPDSDSLVWKATPFKVYILTRSWKLTYFRNQDGKPPRLDAGVLKRLDCGARDLFFYWDDAAGVLKNVTPEIERMAREGAFVPPFTDYFRSTIWEKPPAADQTSREEWTAI